MQPSEHPQDQPYLSRPPPPYPSQSQETLNETKSTIRSPLSHYNEINTNLQDNLFGDTVSNGSLDPLSLTGPNCFKEQLPLNSYRNALLKDVDSLSKMLISLQTSREEYSSDTDIVPDETCSQIVESPNSEANPEESARMDAYVTLLDFQTSKFLNSSTSSTTLIHSNNETRSARRQNEDESVYYETILEWRGSRRQSSPQKEDPLTVHDDSLLYTNMTPPTTQQQQQQQLFFQRQHQNLSQRLASNSSPPPPPPRPSKNGTVSKNRMQNHIQPTTCQRISRSGPAKPSASTPSLSGNSDAIRPRRTRTASPSHFESRNFTATPPPSPKTFVHSPLQRVSAQTLLKHKSLPDGVTFSRASNVSDSRTRFSVRETSPSVPSRPQQTMHRLVSGSAPSSVPATFSSRQNLHKRHERSRPQIRENMRKPRNKFMDEIAQPSNSVTNQHEIQGRFSSSIPSTFGACTALTTSKWHAQSQPDWLSLSHTQNLPKHMFAVCLLPTDTPCALGIFGHFIADFRYHVLVLLSPNSRRLVWEVKYSDVLRFGVDTKTKQLFIEIGKIHRSYQGSYYFQVQYLDAFVQHLHRYIDIK
eukprot:gene10474-2604_t